MDNQDQEKDIARARAAMGGTLYEEKQKERSLELEKRRLEAAAVMESVEHKEKRELEEEELQKRREEAKYAMESTEQKAKREELERIEAQKIKTIKQLQALKEKEKERNQQIATEEQIAAKKGIDREREQQDKYLEHLEETDRVIKNITQKEKTDITSYRTLRTDINQTITRDNLSMAKIALAEQEKNSYQPKRSTLGDKKNNNRRILIWLSLVFIALGSSALAFVFSTKKEVMFNIFSTQSLILVDNQMEIMVDNKSADQVKSEIAGLLSTEPKTKSVTDVFITQTPTDEKGNKLRKKELSINEVFNQLAIKLPLDFSHFLNSEYMMGIDHGSDGDKPFFILITKSFANTFDSLLRNEVEIIGEILSLADPKIKDQLRFQIFEDRIINNINTRSSQSDEGILVLYAFPDHQTLVIAESEATLIKIIDLLKNATSQLKQ